MKQVIVIIRAQRYFETKKALIEERFYAMSTKEVYGRGKEQLAFVSQSDDEVVNPRYANQMIVKKMIEIFVRDQDLERLIKTIMLVNGKNKAGDGKIVVIPIKECVRIHTNERGEDAII